MVGVTLKITGKVQGVFFRKHACEKARDLGVTGWIANEGDGSVVATVEGPSNLVQEFTDWCSSGPSTCRVEKVEATPRKVTGEYEGFEIRY